MASSEKRCLYEVLGLRLECTADEIRSAYKKLALQRHPDKLVQSGVSQSEATASFQELVNAYEVLSDPRERAWYDSHRSQILFSTSNPSNSTTVVPNLFSFFSNSVFSGFSDSGKGFYKVYGDIFDKVYHNELNFATKLGLGSVREAPLMGNLKSPYSQVNAFYSYWLGFATVMDFVWVDQYDAMAGPNRKSRRVMEEENKKLRKKARREYNETVRGLAEFVKKRDKRVIDMQVKRNEEMEKKKEQEKERRKQMERERLERVRAYEEPEWAKVEEEENGEVEEEESEKKKGDGKELYCVACGKKFKSDKQWKNHEQSKKHKEKVAELREAFGDEEGGEGDEVEEEVLGSGDVDGDGFVYANDDGVGELQEQFENGVGIQEQDQSSEEEGFVDIENRGGTKVVGEELKSDYDYDVNDDEASILDAMVSGHKSRKNAGTMRKPKAHVEIDSHEMDFMEYNNLKGTRRNRESRRERSKQADEEAEGIDAAEINTLAKENNRHADDSHVEEEEQSSQSFTETETNGKGDDQSERVHKVPKQAVDKKGITKKDMKAKSKNASKGRKQKATSNTSGHVCEKCGEDFESRNQLHKHLNDTGHASLKSR